MSWTIVMIIPVIKRIGLKKIAAKKKIISKNSNSAGNTGMDSETIASA